MNIDKLKEAEAQFLQQYPGGFADPDMEKIGKRHKVGQMTELAQASFKKSYFKDPRSISDNMVKVVGRSSMVSMFEKPKFRDFVSMQNNADLKTLTDGLKNYLHGNQQRGFEAMVEILLTQKLAKWSVLTIIPNYFHPDTEVFVKPTTAKGVIQHFELEGVEYKPLPSWEFYERYRDIILDMRSRVDPSLAPNNAAFCGFLMMSLQR